MRGRKEVWSDLQIQQLAARFVCATHEAFVLDPPPRFNLNWLTPPNRASWRVFQSFKQNAPRDLIPKGTTVQGIYCMTADGEYLSGSFARTSRDRAKRVLEGGWSRFEQLSRTRGWKPKPVPKDRLDYALGKKRPRGGLKLEVAVRDLPRGRDTKPGGQPWHRWAYNLSWADLTADEAARFVTDKKEKQRLPQSILESFSHTLRDSVRGQCQDWGRNARRRGAIYVECVENEANSRTMRISGHVDLHQPGRAYLCQLHGRVVYDTLRGKFTHFTLVASGQRSGTSQFNFRRDDPGPAPMGVAYVLHEPEVTE